MAVEWFVFALIATLIWSVGAILVKFVRVNYIKSPIGYLIIAAPVTLYSLVFLFFGKVQIPSTKMLLYIAITAIASFVGYWLYLTAIHEEEISRVITLYGLSPLITLILATIFLKEILTISDYLAFPLIIVGSMLISVRKLKGRFRFSHGIILVFISIFLYSIQNLFFKLAAEVDWVSVMILRQICFAIIPISLFVFSKEIRKKTKDDLKQLNKKRLGLLYTAEIMGITGIVFSYLAIQRGPVSLVNLVHGTEGLFVIILATFLSIFIPRILKEEISRKTIGLKITAALLMLLGLYLIVI